MVKGKLTQPFCRFFLELRIINSSLKGDNSCKKSLFIHMYHYVKAQLFRIYILIAYTLGLHDRLNAIWHDVLMLCFLPINLWLVIYSVSLSLYKFFARWIYVIIIVIDFHSAGYIFHFATCCMWCSLATFGVTWYQSLSSLV